MWPSAWSCPEVAYSHPVYNGNKFILSALALNSSMVVVLLTAVVTEWDTSFCDTFCYHAFSFKLVKNISPGQYLCVGDVKMFEEPSTLCCIFGGVILSGQRSEKACKY